MRKLITLFMASIFTMAISAPAEAETLNGKTISGNTKSYISSIAKPVGQAKRTKDGWYLYPAKIEVDQHNTPTCYMAALVNVWNASHSGKQISQAEYWRMQQESEARNDRRLPTDEYVYASWSEMHESGYRIKDWTWTQSWTSALNSAVRGPVYLELMMDTKGHTARPTPSRKGLIPRWTPSRTNIQAEIADGTFFTSNALRYLHAVSISGVNPSKKLVRITNNYGQDWGYKGDVIVTYSDFEKTFMAAFTFKWH